MSKKILVIDDDQDIIESISAVLKSEGYNVVSVTNGKDGFDSFKKEKPDLVLCDMMMEKVDAGIKVAELIKKEDQKARIYLMSSIGNATEANASVSDFGFSGVFQKPVDPSTLKDQVKKALS